MKSLKKKLLIILSICFSLLAGAFAGSFFAQKLKAAENGIDYSLTLQKVKLIACHDEDNFDSSKNYFVEENEKFVYISIDEQTFNLNKSIYYYAKTIQEVNDTNGNAVVLNNADKTGADKEFLFVNFEDLGNANLFTLSVNIKLKNGNNANSIDIDSLEKTTSQSVIRYKQLFDLTNTYILNTSSQNLDNQTPLNEYDAQGLYTFNFKFSIRDNDGIVTTDNTDSASVYLMNDKFYLNGHQTANESAIENNYVEPRLFNTEKIDRTYFETSLTEVQYTSEQNYFNFSNNENVDYDGNLFGDNGYTSDTLLYPTLKYDASKYNLTYTKTIYGALSTFTTKLDTTKYSYPIVVVTETNSAGQVLSTTEITNICVNTFSIGSSQYKQYIVTMEFDEVAKYMFDFEYVLNGEIMSSDFINHEHWSKVGTVQLMIYGYQLEHSEYKNETGATEKEMKYFEYQPVDNITVDETILNKYNVYEKLDNADIYISTIDTTYQENKTYFKRVYQSANILNYESNITSETYVENGALKISNIPTTNQAPLFFKYYSSIDSNIDKSYYYYYTKIGNTYTLNNNKYSLTSNSRFTANGLYVVVLSYNHPEYKILDNGEVKPNQVNKQQVFVFEILSSEPNILINPVDDIAEQNIQIWGSNNYTKYPVLVDWSDSQSSPFDLSPNIKIYRSANFEDTFAETNEYIVKLSNKDLQNKKVVLEGNGKYFVKVEYGPCTYNNKTNTYDYSASVIYSFVIDNQPIDNIHFYTIDNNFDELSGNATNQSFALIYGDIISQINSNSSQELTANGKKQSGAKISVTYTFMPINPYIDSTINAPIDANQNYVANNTSITIKNENITYYQGKIANNLPKATSSILSNDGLYIFTFVDEAGNTATKYVLKDTTKPVILQKVDDEYSIMPSNSSNDENIVNKDVEIVWGTHKAILIDNSLLPIDEDLQNNQTYTYNGFKFYKNNDKIYLLIENNCSYENASNYSADIIKSTKNIVIYYINQDGNLAKSNYANEYSNKYLLKAFDENSKHIKDNEHLFRILISDSLGNSFAGKVELNFDNSLLRAYISGTPYNNKQSVGVNGKYETVGDGTSVRLNENEVTNKKILNISWIEGEGDFKVESVVCEYYPLTFELTDADGNINSNYPYSTTARKTINLLDGISIDTSEGYRKIRSSDINFVYDNRYGEYASAQGMYKVIRTYSSSSVDDYERVYYFYIDRNNIISYEETFEASDNYIGNNLGLQIGDESNKYLFTGKDFLKEFVTKYVLKSNKQPATLIVPTYKYDLLVDAENYIVDKDNNYVLIDGEKVKYDDFVANSKIGINRLSSYITNKNGYEITANNFNIASEYNITVYDVPYYQLDENTHNRIDFVFTVELYSPVANFVDNQTENIMNNSHTDSYISVNNTNVKLVWDNIDKNDYLAKIDENNLSIDMILTSGQVVQILKIENGVIVTNMSNRQTVDVDDIIHISADGKSCYINLNDFENVITKNCRVEITLKYQTENNANYGTYLSSKKIIYFDFEKPQTNYNLLKENDIVYNSIVGSQNNDFDDYNSTINFENYAFAVDSDWTLQTPKNSSFWQYNLQNATTNPNDVLTVWYRVYDKYADESGQNAQSIVPGDPRYDDTTQAPTRYRFNANLKINGKNIYTQITDALENQKFDAGKYVEIIEMDCAGNYRVYTVYIQSKTESIVEYQTANQTDSDEIVTNISSIDDFDKVVSNVRSLEINNKTLVLNKIKNIGSWFMVDVYENDTQINQTIKVAPISVDEFVSVEDCLEIVNSMIYDNTFTGKYFKIVITNSIYGNLAIEYRTPGQQFDLDFDIKSGSMVLTINQNKYGSTTYVKWFKVYEIDENSQVKQLLNDDPGNVILGSSEPLTSNDGVIKYTFTYNSQRNRNLRFDYIDNFGQKYSINQLLGVTQTPFETMLSFTNNYIQNENFSVDNILNGDGEYVAIYKCAEYYTNANQVSLEYQPKIYGNFQIWKDDLSYLINANENTKRKTMIYSLFEDDEPNNDNIYKILFKDTSDRYYLIVVHHYTKVAELNFVDSINAYHCFDENDVDNYESSISRIVYLEYDEYDDSVLYPIQTKVNVTRTYYDSNNIKLTKDYGIVDNHFMFDEYGTYKITATNSLGNSKVYKFELVKSESTYYSVKATVDGKTKFITASSEKYLYNGSYIDHYLSIYDMTVDINQERNLLVDEITKGLNVTTRIYHIYINNNILITDDVSIKYEKYIALTKISTSSNILNGQMYLNDENITGQNRYTRTNAETVSLTIPAYYENEANLLKVSVVYNNQDLGVITKYDENKQQINIVFKSSGIYNIYITDIAGNRHSFGGTAFYTLSLTNNFVCNLNGERSIYNSVYNGPVTLSVLQTDSFTRDADGNRYVVTATLNGNSYTPTFDKGNYIFSSYGTYFVKIRGYINEVDDANLVETELKFTIINQNEAKLMHEYIGLNGYEVIKIEKDGNDITNDIREQLQSATITKFAVYGGQGGIGGNGNYTITVSAFIDDIVGYSEFSYSVWLNKDDDILIVSSLPEGEKTTSKITLQMNLYQIYSKLGECKIKLNGNDYITINEFTAQNNEISTYNLTANNRYNVTLETNNGNTILSFVVTKVEPLNSIAIIVIVIASAVTVGLTLTFILLRKKMRVR